MDLISDPDLNVIALVPALAAGVVAVMTTSRLRRASRVRTQTQVWVDSIRGAHAAERLRDQA